MNVFEEKIKQQTKTREEIRIETRELRRTEQTDGSYNPFNLIHSAVQKRLEQKFIVIDDVLRLYAEEEKKWQQELRRVSEWRDRLLYQISDFEKRDKERKQKLQEYFDSEIQWAINVGVNPNLDVDYQNGWNKGFQRAMEFAKEKIEKLKE